jgi:hypothetical protein
VLDDGADLRTRQATDTVLEEMIEAPTLAFRGYAQPQRDDLPRRLTTIRRKQVRLDRELILVENAFPAPVATLAFLGLGPRRTFLFRAFAPALGLAAGTVMSCRAGGRRARRAEVPR